MGVSLLVAAPPLNLHKVLNFLDSLSEDWRHVGPLLSIPGAVMNRVASEGANNVQRLRSLIHYWLQNDPLASWRRLISYLDKYYNVEDFHKVTDTIRCNAEGQPGQQQYFWSPKLSYTVHEWADMTI